MTILVIMAILALALILSLWVYYECTDPYFHPSDLTVILFWICVIFLSAVAIERFAL